MTALDPEGDFVKRHLLNPVVLRLLGDVRGRRILDAGAGQGYFSRMLAARGAHVVALEPARTLREYAAERERAEPQGVELIDADLTSVRLAARFDAVVANMVFLAIPDWTAALHTCVGALAPGGRLVFSIEHPCLAPGTGSYFAERMLPRRYAPDFHRPLSTYLNAVIKAGCRVEEVVEPALDPALVPDGPGEAAALVDTPGYLVVAAAKLSR